MRRKKRQLIYGYPELTLEAMYYYMMEYKYHLL